MILILLFEYAHITTLFKSKVNIKDLDQDVLKQDAVQMNGETINNENDLKDKDLDNIAGKDKGMLKVVEETQENVNNSIIAKDIIK